ncbi:MAG: helix-turn-helix domain-containing protein [Candidatus Hydrogenedentes bacterium]|nr:helix-turn-helix domain-containing protein [Candidatus Hydrogenedentota bacterium]
MDPDILSIKDVAEILKQDEPSVVRLFEEGALPGTRIGGLWYISRRLLVECVEGNKPPPPVERPVRPALRALPRSKRPPNAWTCTKCGAMNDAERVVCRVCREERITPLVNYIPKR